MSYAPKHHIKAIAQILFDADLDPAARATVAQDFAEYFKAENPRFKRTMFLQACGLG